MFDSSSEKQFNRIHRTARFIFLFQVLFGFFIAGLIVYLGLIVSQEISETGLKAILENLWFGPGGKQ